MDILSVKNMEISIFGVKIKVGVIILIVLLYWILWGHLLCSCSRVGLLEGLETIKASMKNTKKTMPMTASDIMMDGVSAKEGFVGANTNNGESSRFDLSNDKQINTSSWFTPNLTYKAGTSGGKGVQNILNRKKQPIPLPEGEMLMFANTEFKPDCCPNAYSNSTGCACMTDLQYNYLINRGGNNVPYSEY